jgi:hypothetical protein
MLTTHTGGVKHVAHRLACVRDLAAHEEGISVVARHTDPVVVRRGLWEIRVSAGQRKGTRDFTLISTSVIASIRFVVEENECTEAIAILESSGTVAG